MWLSKGLLKKSLSIYKIIKNVTEFSVEKKLSIDILVFKWWQVTVL